MTRAVLVVACLALLVLALLGMRLGWRNRLARQSVLPPLPPLPPEPGEPILTLSGLYVGSSFAGSWQDRVVHERLGERAAAVADLYPAGVLIDREGAPAIFLPAGQWVAARLAPGLAGKVMGEGGLLVVRWRFGPVEVDTALRADDKTVYPAWVTTINKAIEDRVPAGEAPGAPERSER